MASPKIEKSPRTFIHPKTGDEMILIPAGEFMMGEGFKAHRVYVNEFFISRYPVTNAQYEKFVDKTRRDPPPFWKNGKIPDGKEGHAVVYLPWHDAVTYAQWADARLPTEAEWEKAASWDEVKRAKRIFPWGNEFDIRKCNATEYGSGVGHRTPVGKYSPEGDSYYGVGDMVGNVWEWCADLYEDDQSPASLGLRVLRGGSWEEGSDRTRCAYRNYSGTPNLWYFDIGFRLAQTRGQRS